VRTQYVLYMMANINPNLMVNQPYLWRTRMSGAVLKKKII